MLNLRYSKNPNSMSSVSGDRDSKNSDKVGSLFLS
jgi:hypothetical protein